MEILTKIRAWAAALWKRERTESFVTERRVGSPEGRSRRTFWQVTAGTIALGSSAAVRAQTASCTLACKSTFEASVVDLPPLDFPVVWQRRHTASGPAGATHGILGLVAEATGDTSFPWPLYIQLTTSHNNGDAVGAYVRYTPTGNGWGAAFHTDVYHQGGGTSIGANLEVTKKVGSGRAIGVNIQSKGLSTDEAINIQSAPLPSSDPHAPQNPSGAWETGIHFDPGSQGSRAIWIEGAWDTGVDLGANSLAMSSGSKIYLEETRQIYIMFNKASNRVEFHNGDMVIGYVALSPPNRRLA